MNTKHFLIASISLFLCAVVFPVYGYVVTFDDGGIDGLYLDVDGSGIDVTCVSVNGGFTYLSSDVLASGTYDYAYAGDYDYDWPDIVGSGVWMMDDHIPGDVQSSIIEFSDDVYFEQIWFAQAGDDFPVQGDVARITAYAADSTGEHDWLYRASVSFDSTDDFNQWFSISPVSGFEDFAIRKLVLTYDNINYGVWDHLVFVPEPATIALLGIGALIIGRRKR